MTCETHKDLEDTIAKQNDKIFELEKKIDLLNEEIQSTNLIEQKHQELNGQLRKEIDQLKLDKIKAVEDAKKEADKLMMNKIISHKNQKNITDGIIKNLSKIATDKTKEIKQLKKEAKDNLLYP